MMKFDMNQVDIILKQTMKFGDGVLYAFKDTEDLKNRFIVFLCKDSDILLCFKFIKYEQFFCGTELEKGFEKSKHFTTC